MGHEPGPPTGLIDEIRFPMLPLITAILGSSAFAGVFGWIFQLGNRVTTVEVKQEDLPTLINTKFDSVNQRLDRIERAMNGHLRN